MRFKTYIIFTLTLFLLCTNTVFASCTKEEIDKFKDAEDEYTVKYELNKETKTYDIYFSMPYPETYGYNIITDIDIECAEIDEKTTKCINVPPNTYEIFIVGITNTCDATLKNFTIKLPKYNIYSEDPLCEGIEEFVLCNPQYEKDIDYESFVSRVEIYKKSKEKQEAQQEEKPIEDKSSKFEEFVDNAVDYIKENLIEIIIIVIFIVLVILTIILTAKSIRKSRRLD